MAQKDFPALPVPDLYQSCEKYLKSVKPFLNEEEYRETEFIVGSFRTGVGKILQAKLEDRAKSKNNWLIEWWEDIYVAYRGPLPFLSNICGCTNVLPVKQGIQNLRAAFFSYSLIQDYLIIQHEKWPQQYLRKGTPLNLKLYHGLFATSRMPGIEKDVLLQYSLRDGKPTMEIRHIVVIKRKRFFTFDVLTKDFEIISPSEIERQLHRIAAITEAKPAGPGVGSLTSTDRATWKKVQDHLFGLDEENKNIVDIINKSLFVLVLDDLEPRSAGLAAYESAMGDCSNRWFDKEMQAIIFRNGHIGTNNDHAHLDGYITCDLYRSSLKNVVKLEKGWKGSAVTRFLPEPVELEFTVDDYVLKQIEMAEEKHNAAKAQYKMIDREFTKFGKEFAKKHSTHPDALMQMAMQLGYYYMHKSHVPVYETATTRQFHEGRTETVRSCTIESKRFVQAMCNSTASTTSKTKLFREACENHTKMMMECCDGQGIDRHFTGLRIIAEEEGMDLPEIFKDKAWKLSGGDGNFVLSSSLAGYFKIHGGMGPMVANGYGVFYTIENDRIQLVTSTFGTPGTDCDGMWNSIANALCDIRDLLLAAKL